MRWRSDTLPARIQEIVEACDKLAKDNAQLRRFIHEMLVGKVADHAAIAELRRSLREEIQRLRTILADLQADDHMCASAAKDDKVGPSTP